MTVQLLSFSDPAAAGALPVALDRLIESKLLVQANSGGGKSRAVRYLLEQTHGRVQHIVLDREGEFATLRKKFSYALAGPGGETAADIVSAEKLARRTLELGFSLIVDLSEMTPKQQREYVKAFVDSINHVPRTLWKDCLIVIDEAHIFAPESGKGDPLALESISLLVSTGRKRGFCAVLATQRIAKLSKDVSAECLNKMIGRTSEEDLKRAGEELGMAKADAKALRALKPGHFWCYGPAIGDEPTLVRTGEVSTHPPMRGNLREPAPPTPKDIKALLADLADLPQEAVHERENMDALRNRIVALGRELEAVRRAAPPSDPEKVQEAVQRAVAQQQRQQATQLAPYIKALENYMRFVTSITAVNLDAAGVTKEEIVQALEGGLGRLTQMVELRLDGRRKEIQALQKEAERMQTQIATLLKQEPQQVELVVSVAKQAPFRVDAGATKPRAKPERAVAAVHDGVKPAEQRLLNALAELDDIGVSMPDRVQLGMFCGRNLTGGSGGQVVADVIANGWAEIPEQGGVRLTPAGHAFAVSSGAPGSLRELHARILNRLGAGERRVLAHLLSIYPQAISRGALGEIVGRNLTGGSGGQVVADLVTLGAAIIPSKGLVRASDLLFPEGLS